MGRCWCDATWNSFKGMIYILFRVGPSKIIVALSIINIINVINVINMMGMINMIDMMGMMGIINICCSYLT